MISDLVKSYEYVGSGGQADQRILIANEIAVQLQDEVAVRLTPCKPTKRDSRA